MTKNTEQNAFRSRDAQEDALTYHLGGLQAEHNFRLLARAMIQEAEARGAAAQRARDSKECDAKCGLILEGPTGRFRIVNFDGTPLNDLGIDKYQPLYLRPFNIDYLEEEISRLTKLLETSEEYSKAVKKESLEHEDKHLKALTDATDELKKTRLCFMLGGEA